MKTAIKKAEVFSFPIAKPEDSKKFASTNEALGYFGAQEHMCELLPLRECRMTEEGRLRIGAAKAIPFSDRSFQQLTQLLDAPYAFLKKADPTLTAHTVNQLLDKLEDQRVQCWINSNDSYLEAITGPEFKPIRHLDCLRSFSDAFNSEAQEIALSGGFLHIRLLLNVEIQPIVKDTFKLGVELTNYDFFSEQKYLNIASFLYRLICSNGAMSKSTLQSFQDAFKPPIAAELITRKMKELTNENYSSEEKELIGNAISWMAKSKLGELHSELYLKFYKQVKRELAISEDSPFGPEQTYYDFFNYVTRSIQSTSLMFRKRRELQQWAGSLIDAYLQAKDRNRPTVIWEDTAIAIAA